MWYKIRKAEDDRHQPCSCTEFSYILEDLTEDRDLDAIASRLSQQEALKTLVGRKTHVTRHSRTGSLITAL